jgi:hypothetical protein
MTKGAVHVANIRDFDINLVVHIKPGPVLKNGLKSKDLSHL